MGTGRTKPLQPEFQQAPRPTVRKRVRGNKRSSTRFRCMSCGRFRTTTNPNPFCSGCHRSMTEMNA